MATGRAIRRFRALRIVIRRWPASKKAVHLVAIARLLALPASRYRSYRWCRLGFIIGGLCDDDGFGGSARFDDIDALDTTRAGLDRDDGDLEPAIRLDAVHRAAQSKARHHAGRAAVHLLAAHHPADLLLAVPGVPGRPLRAKTPDLDRRHHVGRQLG